MSILNRPSDGLFNILITFIRCLVEQGPMPPEKLLGLCAPLSAVGSQDRAKQTLNRWCELGLLTEVDGKVKLGLACEDRLNRKSLSTQIIADTMRRVALTEENNANFWESENNRSADFTRAACWILAQDVYLFQPSGHGEVEQLESKQLGKLSAFTNDTRWSGFKSWATFLGIGYSARFPSNSFVIDPTECVMACLSENLEERRFTIADFLEELAQKLPIVDNGIYRRLVEEKISAASWKRPFERSVSTSLSRAILRLRDSRHLILEDNSDAESHNLIGREQRKLEAVSHVVWKGGAA